MVLLLQALWWMTPHLVQVLRLKRCLRLHGKCSEPAHRPGYASVKNNQHSFFAASVGVRGSSYLSWAARDFLFQHVIYRQIKSEFYLINDSICQLLVCGHRLTKHMYINTGCLYQKTFSTLRTISFQQSTMFKLLPA